MRYWSVGLQIQPQTIPRPQQIPRQSPDESLHNVLKLEELTAAVAIYTKNLEDLLAPVASYTRKLGDFDAAVASYTSKNRGTKNVHSIW